MAHKIWTFFLQSIEPGVQNNFEKTNLITKFQKWSTFQVVCEHLLTKFNVETGFVGIVAEKCI